MNLNPETATPVLTPECSKAFNPQDHGGKLDTINSFSKILHQEITTMRAEAYERGEIIPRLLEYTMRQAIISLAQLNAEVRELRKTNGSESQTG